MLRTLFCIWLVRATAVILNQTQRMPCSSLNGAALPSADVQHSRDLVRRADGHLGALIPLLLSHAAANNLAHVSWSRLYQGHLKGTMAESRKNYSLDTHRDLQMQKQLLASHCQSNTPSPLRQAPLLGVLVEQPRQVRVWRPVKEEPNGAL